MSKATSLFLFGAFVAVTVGSANGCASKNSGESLDAESAALVEDNAEVDDTESTLESGLEEPTSGAAALGAEIALDAADPVIAATAAKANAGLFFKPAGCIQSTLAGAVVTHVFKDCTGPEGLVAFNGTVTSTWKKIPGGFEVTHEAKGFKANGASVDHTVTIDYTKTGGVYTKHRVGSTTGLTAKGKAITHSADYVTTYDPSTKCLTRNGSSTTTIGARNFSRSIDGYVRCGIGSFGCPNSGKFLLKTPKLSLELDFPGGPLVDVKLNGKSFERPLLCRAS